jgi:hypothetical protein
VGLRDRRTSEGGGVISNVEKQAEKERNFTAEMLRAALHYDPLTGIFRHIKAKRGVRAGAIAGRVSGKGYWQICINYQYFYAHRLAWLYVTGEWPSHEIDHDDLNKQNNRFSNLRPATDLQNQGNRPVSRHSRSRVKGVRWNKIVGKWQARITDNSKDRHLGYFNSKSEAAEAYRRAAEEKFGQFARAS